VNVSHGCVNMSPADAQTYYQMENPGDPVMITGSPAAGTWDNGWTVWFLSWRKLVRGSALGMAVQAGADGSTFVSPSSVPRPRHPSRCRPRSRAVPPRREKTVIRACPLRPRSQPLARTRGGNTLPSLIPWL
jgi:hypothetical protein